MRNLIVFVLFFSFAVVKSQDNPKNTLDSLFTLYENKDKLFGSAELLKDNQALYRKSIGWQNSWQKRKNDSLTVYPVGRITELFVQALFFQLMEDGKVKLSDKLSGYYKEIPNSGNITLESLLRHKSGLVSIDSLYVNNTKEKVIQYLKENPELKKEKYSNLDYLLLGFILEDVSGENFHDLLKKRISDRIGLKNTFYGEKLPEEHLAVSYYKKDNDWKKNFNQDFDYYRTSGGIYSDPHDLNLFISALYNGKLFRRKNVDKYFKEKENKCRIGLYNEKDKTVGGYVIQGKLKGFQIQLRYFEKENINTCIISNAADNVNQDFLTNALLDFYNKKPIKFPNFSLMDKWTGQNN